MDAVGASRIKNRYRLNNIPRMLIAGVFLGWFYHAGLPRWIVAMTAVFVGYTLLWFVLVELEIRVIFREELRYLRIFFDSFGLTVGVLITGGVSSPGLITYAGTVGLASLYLTPRYAVFSMVVNFFLFNAGLVLTSGGVLPAMNLLAEHSGSSVTTASAVIFSNFIILLYSAILHLVIFPNYKNLHRERASLASRNAVMENELSLARTIQEALIPTGAPASNMAFLFKPMDQVGGDFFDFIHFENRALRGIFVCDVSGHGVPAALLAAMLKTIVLQAGDNKRHPAALLAYVNATLQGLTAGNFVTAFYAVYDSQDRILRYANAGHPFPFLIAAGKVTQLEGHRTPPLGVWNVAERAPGESVITLHAKSRLLCFTDGLTEASASSDPNTFFDGEALHAAIRKGMQYSCKEQIELLYSALVGFHGQESFDDDICLICFEAD